MQDCSLRLSCSYPIYLHATPSPKVYFPLRFLALPAPFPAALAGVAFPPVLGAGVTGSSEDVPASMLDRLSSVAVTIVVTIITLCLHCLRDILMVDEGRQMTLTIPSNPYSASLAFSAL